MWTIGHFDEVDSLGIRGSRLLSRMKPLLCLPMAVDVGRIEAIDILTADRDRSKALG